MSMAFDESTSPFDAAAVRSWRHYYILKASPEMNAASKPGMFLESWSNFEAFAYDDIDRYFLSISKDLQPLCHTAKLTDKEKQMYSIGYLSKSHSDETGFS